MSGRVAGILIVLAFFAAAPVGAEDAARRTSDGATKNVLSISWQPGFCETRHQRPECLDKAARWRSADAFSLHGLWQVGKSYCRSSPQERKALRTVAWTALPPLALSDETRERLDSAMPGVVSGLDRHQWLRNGTCHAAAAEDYFRRNLDMLDRINASAVEKLFSEKAGGDVTIADVRGAFEQSFGAGAGDRVRLSCRKSGGSTVVTGLTIGLGPIAEGVPFEALVRAAGKTESRCRSGRVIAANGA